MSSVKVAVRVRPLNQRELNLDSQFIIEMDRKKTTIANMKMSRGMGDTSREFTKDFTFDHSYWSVDPTEDKFDSQEQVFKDLGVEVITSAYDGYNACMFAYGQTGSGKTYTMMGSPSDPGLIPRICQELYNRMNDPNMTYRTEVSYLEIYNEKVRDLIDGGRSQHALRVREHPKEGPYVQDLSKHIVIKYTDILELMNRGNVNRTTASTGMNDVSSRSHAIFTMTFTQAKFGQDGPSEMHSKIHLVDLAGSERADATGATGQRLKEGGSINKSLVTLGKIISTLADASDKARARKPVFIPYRDSVLTWLLKDSLGGNAKTIMVATISPADCNYAESLSTLRYANRAKNIINKPTVNEDQNVRLIRDLRDEISRLKTLLGGKSDGMTAPRVQEKLHENEARVKVLTEEWTGKWKEMAHILKEEKMLALRKEGLGVVLDSDLPHLIGIDDDILSTGIMLYHLKEGKTTMGTGDDVQRSDIVLQGEAVLAAHCAIEHHGGQVTLIPAEGALCTVNGSNVSDPVSLSQGAVILLGKTNMFRFNHPAQAAKLRQEFKESNMNLTRISSLSQSMNDLARSTENLALITSGWEMEQRHQEQLESLENKRVQIEEMEERHRAAEGARTREQEEHEAALEEKRQQLAELAEQSIQTKREAEMMKQQMMQEAALLKRRSMDVERQYALYVQKKTQLEEQSQERESVETPGGEGEHERVRRQVEEELQQLTQREKEAIEQARIEKDRLKQEVTDLEENYKSQRATLEAKVVELDEQVAQRTADLETAEAQIEKEWRSLQTRREKEQETLERQVKLLEEMRSDQEAFYTHTSELDTAARHRLESEHARLREVQEDVKQREKALYTEYRDQLTVADARRAQGEAELVQEQTQLDADKVYLQECAARVEQAVSRMDELTEDEVEQLERESIAIETERERIREDEEKLEVHRSKVQSDYDTEREELQRVRDEQVESLVYDKEKLKEMEALRGEAILGEMSRTRQELTSLRAALEDKEKELEEQEKLQKQKRFETEVDVTSLQNSKETLSSELLALEQETLTMRETLTQKKRDLELMLQQDMRNAETRRKMLEELENKQLAAAATGEQLQDERAQFEHYQKTKQGALLVQERHLEDARQQDARSEQKHTPKMLHKMKELEKLEDQLRASEAELEESRARLERERQEELDRIDMEKFTLQEMEDQERINALVEQEVKRRLFEERVQREKQRRMEREKEKLEREKELSKIKKAHDREIQKLKEKYETSNAHVNTNAPTKANPYANIMIAENSGSHRRDRSMERSLTAGRMSVVPLEENRVDLSIPGYIQRGSTLDTHYEFEVKLTAGPDTWSVYRRYSRFRELHQDLKGKHPQIGALVFPPKKWFSNRSEKVVAERRRLLEDYLRNVVQVLQRNPACALHPSRHKLYTKQVLHEFHPFFKKGLFETTKHGTG